METTIPEGGTWVVNSDGSQLDLKVSMTGSQEYGTFKHINLQKIFTGLYANERNSIVCADFNGLERMRREDIKFYGTCAIMPEVLKKVSKAFLAWERTNGRTNHGA